MMMPATPGSVLKKNIERRIKEVDDKVKVVEKTGEKLVSVMKRLVKKGEKEGCGREDCLVCANGGKGDCMAARVVYEVRCLKCEENDIKAIYVGETYRCGYVRGTEHMDLYEAVREKVESMMKNHSEEVHGGEKVKWAMDILKGFRRNPLARQVFEGVRIRNRAETSDYVLNTREEFVQPGEITPEYSSCEVRKRARK